MRCYVLDVFARHKYTGNQLAVFEAAEGLSTETMQALAREMNFSETTFVLPGGSTDAGFPVRIFTPAREVPFAGHPVLGTAYAIRHLMRATDRSRVTLNVRAGSIPVDFEGDALFMKQNEPAFGPTSPYRAVADMLGLEKFDIDHRYPVQEVSTGLPFIIVPVTKLDAISSISLNVEAYNAFVADRDAKGILTFCMEAESPDCQARVRMFAPAYGITEDPATGSGNGCLAAYMVKHGVTPEGKVDLKIEQGVEMGRPSLLILRAAERPGGGIDVHVGGSVIPVLEGRLI